MKFMPPTGDVTHRLSDVWRVKHIFPIRPWHGKCGAWRERCERTMNAIGARRFLESSLITQSLVRSPLAAGDKLPVRDQENDRSSLYSRIKKFGWIIRLRERWSDLRYSLWFVPTIIVLGAIVLATGLVQTDGILDDELMDKYPRLFGAGAEGSRGMLSAIASSMITVAGVTFSITVVALTLASNQFSPRILRNFMSSRETQAVLGIFVGIYAYCLVVLRTIRGGDESFVPSVAVLFGVLLAIVGVYVLIFFIHHIASSIQVSQIIGDVADETKQAIEDLFPTQMGAGKEPEESESYQPPKDGWRRIPATFEGYIQTLDSDALLEFATDRNRVVRMERTIGEFVVLGTPLVSIWPSDGVSKKDEEAANSLFVIGRTRTVREDATFGIQLIVDVALKALSAGINDTATAVNCIDALSGILAKAADRSEVSKYRVDDGIVRVIAKGPDFESLLVEAFSPIRRSSNFAVLIRMLGAMEAIGYRTNDSDRRQLLISQTVQMMDHAKQFLQSPADRDAIIIKAGNVLAFLGER